MSLRKSIVCVVAASTSGAAAAFLLMGGEAVKPSEGLEIFESSSSPIGIDLASRGLPEEPTGSRFGSVSELLSLAEHDLPAAVRRAVDGSIDDTVLIALFKWWFEQHGDALLRELREIANPAVRQAAALAIVEQMGNDLEAFSKVAAAAGTSVLSLRMEAITERAKRDPEGALRTALELPYDFWRRAAIRRVARGAAWWDQERVWGVSSMINDPDLEAVYEAAVLEEWSLSDAASVFAYVEASDPDSMLASVDVLRTLAAGDPRRVLELSEFLPPPAAAAARTAAVRALAEADLAAAVGYLDSLSPAQREQLVPVVAAAYGSQDPDAALSWARSLQPPSASAIGAALSGAASVEPEHAFALTVGEILSADDDRAAALLTVLPALVLQSSDVGAKLDRLSIFDVPGVNSLMNSVVIGWSARDPEGALDWALRNRDLVRMSAFSALAETLGGTNVEFAQETVEKLPPEMRDAWITGVVKGIARVDLESAVEWISPYRGQDVYEQAMASVIFSFDTLFGERAGHPQYAAQLLEQVSTSMRARMAPTVAHAWAQQDPEGAASWAISVRELDEARRSDAVHNVVTVWARSDESAAKRWALNLPSGPVRDRAITAYLSSSRGDLDPGLFDSLSSDAAREIAAIAAVSRVGVDPSSARQLIEKHISNPAARLEAEERLVRAALAPNLWPEVVY